MRGRFFWRLGCALLVLFVLVVAGATVAVWVLTGGTGPPGPDRPPRGFDGRGPGPLLLLLVLALVVLLVARAFRRVAAPVGALIEAAGRVQAGDYSVRLAEWGPTEVRAVARAFNEMSARLQATEQQRRNLLADVTHELRTPLTVIQGRVEGLVDGVYPADEAHLRAILEETHVLGRLIDDLRTLAMAEIGALPLHTEPTDLEVLANDVLASFRPQADAATVTLSVRVEDEVPLLEVDPVRTREVLSNLIANALRYTPRGGSIDVRAQLATSGSVVAVSVSDTGSGIAPEALPHVFDRFYKSGESAGTGLGLAVVKNLVVAQGGDVSVESTPGDGTTIRFTLPVARP